MTSFLPPFLFFPSLLSPPILCLLPSLSFIPFLYPFSPLSFLSTKDEEILEEKWYSEKKYQDWALRRDPTLLSFKGGCKLVQGEHLWFHQMCPCNLGLWLSDKNSSSRQCRGRENPIAPKTIWFLSQVGHSCAIFFSNQANTQHCGIRWLPDSRRIFTSSLPGTLCHEVKAGRERDR